MLSEVGGSSTLSTLETVSTCLQVTTLPFSRLLKHVLTYVWVVKTALLLAIIAGDGSGGDSIYNGCFNDEKKVCQISASAVHFAQSQVMNVGVTVAMQHAQDAHSLKL